MNWYVYFLIAVSLTQTRKKGLELKQKIIEEVLSHIIWNGFCNLLPSIINSSGSLKCSLGLISVKILSWAVMTIKKPDQLKYSYEMFTVIILIWLCTKTCFCIPWYDLFNWCTVILLQNYNTLLWCELSHLWHNWLMFQKIYIRTEFC